MRMPSYSQISLTTVLRYSNALVFLIFVSFNAAIQEAVVRPTAALAAGRNVATAASIAAGPSVAWPVRLSAKGKYLEQQNGEPFHLGRGCGMGIYDPAERGRSYRVPR